jgi:chemotaxis protein CheX
VQSHEGVKDLLDSTIESLCQVIQIPTDIKPPNVYQAGVVQSEIGVLVGITGDVYGRILLEGSSETFIKLGEAMFGMPLEGEMLHSFIGEIANMIAGKTSTIIFEKGRTIDITPPTVMVGKFQLYGFQQGISVAIDISNVGEFNIILLVQNQGVA